MSSVDNRIVRMQFDNGQFESGASKTLGTLARLKEALNFSGAAKGLEGISAAASNVNLSGLTDGVNSANNSFSVLGVAAGVVLGNIATKAIEVGSQIAKAFVLDPVLQGFNEYELKMNSIQTMMMSTGEPLERVNQKLNELNTYADKTIYSFSDMTQNIGKFTNAGVGLDKSVAAIQGVANVAALSGANATDASHAMYNFGQALSSGAVRLQDWKSIEVANMATVEFKEQLISTALAMGTLRQEGDKYISTTTDLNGKVSDAFNATQMFNDSLSSQWMTTDVLTETLNRYADETTDIGKKAFKAATQVKTFSQMLDTTKEAIGTGWADTFEIVIGNFEEARDLWTSVASVIDDFVGKQAKARNDMLQSWKDLGGRTNLIQGLSNVFSALGDVMGAIGKAWQNVFPPWTGTKLALLTKGFLDFTEKLKPSEALLKAITNVFTGLFSVLGLGVKAFQLLLKPVGLVVSIFSKLIGLVVQLLSPFGALLGFLNNSVLSSTHLSQAGRILTSVFEALISPIKKFGNLFEPVFGKAKDLFDAFGDKVSETFTKVSNAVKYFDLEDAIEPITRFGKAVVGVFAAVGIAVGTGLQKLGGYISEQAWFQNLKSELDDYRDTIADTFRDLANDLGEQRIKLSEKMKEIGKALSEMDFESLKPMLNEAKESATEGFNAIRERFEDFRNWLSQFEIDTKIGNLSSMFKSGLETAGNAVKAGFEKIKEIFEEFAHAISNYEFGGWDKLFDDLGKSFSSIGETIRKSISNIPSVIQSAFNLVGIAIRGGSDIIAGAFRIVIAGISYLWESAGGTITGVIETIGEQIQRGFDFITRNAEIGAETIRKIIDDVTKILTSKNFGENLETGIFGVIALGIKHLLDSFAEFTKKGAGLFKNVRKVLDEVRGCLEAYQKSLKAESLMKIAQAIAILAASIFVLALLPADQLLNAVVAVGAAATELMVAMKVFSKIADKTDFSGLGKVSIAMLSLSTSVLILGLALKSMSGLNWEELAVGLVGVTALIAELAVVSLVLSKNEAKFSKGVFSLMMFALAIKSMADAVSTLGSIDTSTVVQGVVSVGALTAALVAFVAVAQRSKLTVGSGLAVMEIAAAINIMCMAVEKLGSMDIEGLIQGIISLGALLAELAVFTTVLGKSSGLASSGLGLIGIGAAMLEFAAVIAIFGNMDLKTLAQGLIALGVALAELAVASMAMQGTIGSSVAILSMAAALAVLTPVIIILGSVPWQVLATGLITIAAAFTILGIAGAVLAPIAPIIMALAASLLTVAAAVVVTSAGLIAFGVALTAIAAGIVAFAAVSTVAIEAFLLALEALISGLLKLIVNVGDDLAKAGAALVEALADGLASAAGSIARAVVAIGDALLQAIIELSYPLAEAGVVLVESLIQAIADHAYEITDATLVLITEFINGITNNLTPIIDAGARLAIEFINGTAIALRENIGPLMDALENLWNSIVYALLEIMQKLVEDIPAIGDKMASGLESAKEKLRSQLSPEQLGQIGSDAVEGLNQGLQSGTETTTQTAQQLGMNVTQSLKDGVGDLFPVGSEKGLNFASGLESMTGLAQGAGLSVGTGSVTGLESVSEMFPNDGTTFGTNFSSALASMSGEAQSSGDQVGESAVAGVESHSGEFNPLGEEDGSSFASGIDSKSGDAQSAGSNLANSAVNGASGSTGTFQSLGEDAGQGFANGIMNKIQSVAAAAANLVRSAINAAKSEQDSNSPSKEFAKLGVWADEGMIEGYRQKEDDVAEAAGRMVGGALTTVGTAIVETIQALENSDDFEPTITPVLDLSDVTNSANQISGLLDTSPSMRMAAEIQQTRPQEVRNELLTDQLQSALNNQNGRIIDGLEGVRADIVKLADAVTRMQIVMDTGTLVGQLVNPMDIALGQNMLMAERGM